jgi:hypothetical protein
MGEKVITPRKKERKKRSKVLTGNLLEIFARSQKFPGEDWEKISAELCSKCQESHGKW